MMVALTERLPVRAEVHQTAAVRELSPGLVAADRGV